MRIFKLAFNDISNFYFYSFFLIKRRLFSKTYIFTLIGISILFVGMAWVFNNFFSSFNSEFAIAARFLGFSFSYQIAIASIGSFGIILLIYFISTEILEQKITRSIELVITSIRPSVTMISIIISYSFLIILMGGWALGNVYFAQHFFHNYFLDGISIMPKNISFHNFLIGIAILNKNYIGPSNPLEGITNGSQISWNPDTQSFGWYVVGLDSNSNFDFLPLNAFKIYNSQLFIQGLKLIIIISIHYIILMIVFSYFSCILASIMSSSQDLQYALFPIYAVIAVPFVIYPFLRGASTSLTKILSYIPCLNTSFYLSTATDSSLTFYDKLSFFIPELSLLIILFIATPKLYKMGILNNSKNSFFKQIYFLIKIIFSRNIGYLKLKKIKS